MRVILGLLIFGIGLIIDAFTQMKLFAQGGYLDQELWGKVFEAIWKLTLGFIIVIGLVYFAMEIARDFK
jgi:hypothetical protein